MRAASGLVRLVAALVSLSGVAFVFLCALCFFGRISQMAPVESAITAIESALPAALAGRELVTPAGGVLHVGYLAIGTALACGSWPLSRLADRLGRR